MPVYIKGCRSCLWDPRESVLGKPAGQEGPRGQKPGAILAVTLLVLGPALDDDRMGRRETGPLVTGGFVRPLSAAASDAVSPARPIRSLEWGLRVTSSCKEIKVFPWKVGAKQVSGQGRSGRRFKKDPPSPPQAPSHA